MTERRAKRNEELRNGVLRLVEYEKAYATAEYGDAYHSPVEGYGVIREESIEVSNASNDIHMALCDLDRAIRQKEGMKPIRDEAANLEKHAIATAIEAIHVAAAAAKLRYSIDYSTSRFF